MKNFTIKSALLALLLLPMCKIVQAQQNTTVLQPDSVYYQRIYYEGNDFETYNYKGAFSYNEDGTLSQILNSCDQPDYWGNRYWNFVYDNLNNLVEYEFSSYLPGGASRKFDMIFDGDKIIGKQEWQFFIKRFEWVLVKEWKAFFDDNGRIVGDSTFQSNGSSSPMYLASNTTYVYNDNEIVITNYGYQTLRSTITLDANGKTQSVKTELGTDGSFVNNDYTEYHYVNDFLESTETSHWDGDWIPYSKDIFSRNSEGAVIMAEHKLWNGAGYGNYKKTTYNLNDEGYPLSIQFQDYIYSSDTWIDGASYVEEHNNYILMQNEIADLVFTQKHLQFIDMAIRNGNPFYGRIDFTYTETANPHYDIAETEDMPVTVHPNPTNGIVTVTGENLSEIEVVNILGQTVLKKDCSDDITVDLSNQPAGVYLLRITDKNGDGCTRKVIKKQM